jgi:hypothetical protein
MKGSIFLTLMIVSILMTSAYGGDWTADIKLKGDFRYRHEMIDEQDSDARHRHRIRARVGIEGKVNDNMKVGIQLATGSHDPVSTNQTLDNAFSTKDIMLDLAYLNFSPKRIEGLEIQGGKFKNPFFKPGKSELIWDSDWNPEGGVATFERDFSDVSITLIGAGLWIDERSDADDSWLAAGQGVLHYKFNEKKTGLAFGAGFFNYVNSAGFDPFYDADDPMGNSIDDDSLYLVDYEILELYGELSHRLGYVPVTVMADYVTNTAADSVNNGWLVGLHIGKVKMPGTWALRYIYREVEKDAVVGMFTDSDFRGGGTDAKGHEMGGQYQLADNTTFNITYFINKIGLDAAEADFNRLQVDLQLKF